MICDWCGLGECELCDDDPLTGEPCGCEHPRLQAEEYMEDEIGNG